MFPCDLEARVLGAISRLCGPANNFVGEADIMNSLHGWGFTNVKSALTSLVIANRLECIVNFVPMMNNLCGCGSGCSNGASGGGCCGCGRYYRIKIG